MENSGDFYFRNRMSFTSNKSNSCSVYGMVEVLTRTTDLFYRHGFTRGELNVLFDKELTFIFRQPCFNLVKLDDIFRSKYGEYEKQGKTMSDIFSEVFGNDAEEMKKYFLVDTEENNEV